MGLPLLASTKEALLCTTGVDPESQINQLTKDGDYLAVIILNFPDQKLGLVRHVITDFASHFGSKKLSFTAELTSLYLRKLQEIVQYSKYMHLL